MWSLLQSATYKSMAQSGHKDTSDKLYQIPQARKQRSCKSLLQGPYVNWRCLSGLQESWHPSYLCIFRCLCWQNGQKTQSPRAAPLAARRPRPAGLIYSSQLRWTSLWTRRSDSSQFKHSVYEKASDTSAEGHNSNWHQFAVPTKSPRTEQKKTKLSSPFPGEGSLTWGEPTWAAGLQHGNGKDSCFMISNPSWAFALNRRPSPPGRRGKASPDSSVCRNASAASLVFKSQTLLEGSWSVSPTIRIPDTFSPVPWLQLAFYASAF